MQIHNCRNCGAPLPPYSSQCEYCSTGSHHILPNAEWIAEAHAMPDRSAADPNRSVYVLTTCCLVAVGMQQEKGKFDYYSEIIAAYYDFTKKKWFNEGVPDSDGRVVVTHWMPLPAENAAGWLPIAERGLPDIESPEGDGYSIYVLVSLTDLPYDRSITCAQVRLSSGYWITNNEFINVDRMKVERWMMIPPPPNKR